MNEAPALSQANPTARRQGRITLPPRPDAAEAFEAALKALVHDFGAEEIWVYGSCARGNPDRHSDVDFLVIRSPRPDSPSPATAARLCLAGLPYFFPHDIIVLDPLRWNGRRRHPTGVYLDLVRNGIQVFKPDRR